MTQKTLASYIKEQLGKGYDINTIKYHLMKHGYTSAQVDGAMSQTSGQTEVNHIIHFSPAATAVLVSIVLVLIISGLVFFFVIKEKPPEQLLDIELEGIVTTAEQGSEISFISKLSSLGAKKRYDVVLKHEIISQKTNRILTFKEETKAIETSASFQSKITLPEDAPAGDYILRTIVQYNSQKAIATLPVKIEESEKTTIPEVQQPVTEQPNEEPEETCYDQIKNQDEEKTDCGGICSPCEDGTSQPSKETGSIDIDKLSSFESLEQIRELAKKNPADAASYCPKFEFQTSKDICYEYVGEESADIRYCEKIQDERTKDICYANVAVKLLNPKLCEEIKKDDRRDNCYVSFIILEDKKDFSVCEKVTNEHLKISCNTLKQLNDINATQIAYYQDLIKGSLVSLSLEN